MHETILLRIAKTAILRHFDTSFQIDKNILIRQYPSLCALGAAFVTLNYDSQLRGCIGSVIAHRSLLDDVMHNALSAAFNDPRFTPLKATELSHLQLEVSVLTEPKLLHYSDFDDLLSKIHPHIDGLILKYGTYQGTFLPQVWEQLPQAQEFLEHLSYKAGADPSIYTHHPEIYNYEVQSIKEPFETIEPL
jgi:uncharacterized protein